MHIQGDDKSLTLGAKLDREGCLLVFKRHQKPTTVHTTCIFRQNKLPAKYFDCRVFITTVHYFGSKSVQILVMSPSRAGSIHSSS